MIASLATSQNWKNKNKNKNLIIISFYLLSFQKVQLAYLKNWMCSKKNLMIPIWLLNLTKGTCVQKCYLTAPISILN